MIKKTVLAITILCISSVSHSLDITSVSGTKFNLGFLIGNCEIQFNKDNTYEANYGSEGLYWYNKGKYSIKNSTVYLMPSTCKFNKENADSVPCGQTLGRAECRMVDDRNSLYYTKYLECNSIDNKNVLGFNTSKILFPLTSYPVASGAERVYDGTAVVVLTGSTGVTTANVKIRKKPSVDSESLKFTDKIYFDPGAKTYDYVPQNTAVTIIARTKNKSAVDKWNNYWYLISAGMSIEVWMYGEFVKLK